MFSSKPLRTVFVLLLTGPIWLTNVLVAHAQEDAPADFDFHITHRINAHGDEFNSLALSADGRRVVVGTEKGEVVVWNVAAGRVERRLVQGAPVHGVVALAEPRYVVAAGGAHFGSRRTSVIRKWDIERGTFDEWPGVGHESFFELAADPRSGLVAAASVAEHIASQTGQGHVAVWTSTGQQIALWTFDKEVPVALAVIGMNVYVTLADPQAVLNSDEEAIPANAILVFDAREPKRAPRKLSASPQKFWLSLAAAPDGRLLAAGYVEQDERHIALLEPTTGVERAQMEVQSAVWAAPDQLLLFDPQEPSGWLRLKPDGSIADSENFFAHTPWHGGHGAGEPTDFKGAVVAADGQTVFGVFRLGAALVKWNVQAQDRRAEILTMTPGLVYTLDVLAQGDQGLIITGGDDRFVRVWQLPDFNLRREYAVPFGVPQGVGLLADGRHAVFSYGGRERGATDARADNSPHVGSNEPPAKTQGHIVLMDIETSAQKELLSLSDPFTHVVAAGQNFIYHHEQSLVLASGETGATVREFKLDAPVAQFALSNNRRLLAAADNAGSLYVFELATGQRGRVSKDKIKALSCLAVTNDGRNVYTTEFEASIRRWDTQTDTPTQIGGVRGQCRALSLSQDERRLVIGGNHRDFAVYDAHTGKRIGYFDTEAADFYVTNVWLAGDHLIYTTDGGVLFAGQLQQ